MNCNDELRESISPFLRIWTCSFLKSELALLLQSFSFLWFQIIYALFASFLIYNFKNNHFNDNFQVKAQNLKLFWNYPWYWYLIIYDIGWA